METHETSISCREVAPWVKKANFLLRELARVWYGKGSKHVPDADYRFMDFFMQVVYQYGESNGLPAVVMAQRLAKAEIRFRKFHNMQPKFKTPAFWAVWVVGHTLPKEQRRAFLTDWRIRLILRLAHNIAVQRSRYNEPPYKPFKGLKPIEYFEALEVWEPPKVEIEGDDLPF